MICNRFLPTGWCQHHQAYLCSITYFFIFSLQFNTLCDFASGVVESLRDRKISVIISLDGYDSTRVQSEWVLSGLHRKTKASKPSRHAFPLCTPQVPSSLYSQHTEKNSPHHCGVKSDIYISQNPKQFSH